MDVKHNTGNLKTIVRGAYDIQKLRIQMGNRIVGNFKAKLGQAPSEKEEKMDSAGLRMIRQLRSEYKLIADGIVKTKEIGKTDKLELICTQTELCLVQQYFELKDSEELHFKRMGKVLKEYPIFIAFLEGVKGVGPAMAGVIISEIDIHRAKYPSSLWKYSGLDVAKDGGGRSRKSEHLVESEYTAKDGTVKKKMGITFNPFLKTKLTGVLGASFLKCKSPYSKIYYDYKLRLQKHPDHKEKSKLHIHNMANRKMIKIFLIDLHREWRALEGFPASVPYCEAKLGMTHGRDVRAEEMHVS